MHPEFYINSTKMTFGETWCGTGTFKCMLLKSSLSFFVLKIFVYEMNEKPMEFSST